ncbi:hypothetical protein LJC61_01485 [Ruminococcaceae bacterium OttesenSCG-928-A16]|nr:hypothetical protein [Ruminococcaceae bacterium OttesenSCG-928-A16]
MQKKVYHTQRVAINAKKPADVSLKNTRSTSAISAAAVRVSNKQAHTRRAGWVIMLLCLALAVLSAVLVPLLVGGASPAIAAEPAVRATAAAPVRAESSYTDLRTAEQELGFTPALPATMPANTVLTAIRVVDGDMLEMEYVLDNVTLLYRTAQSNEDLSDANRTYTFTTTQEEDGVARMYSGSTENKLSLAVWAEGGKTYAIQTSNEINAETMKEIALSVA